MSRTKAEKLQIVTAQWILPMDRPPIEQGFLAMVEGEILAVGGLSELPNDWMAEAPKPGTLLTPGLVNAHTHLEQSFPQPIHKGADEPFSTWLLRVVRHTHADSSSDAKFKRSLNGAREVLSTGTTCVNDIASGSESFNALAQLGLRGTVSLEVFHPAAEPVVIDHWIEKYQALQQAFAGHSLLRLGLSPHSPYNVAPGAWQALLKACQPALVHTHLAEFEDETFYLQGKKSCVQDLHQHVLGLEFSPQMLADSPVAYLYQFGLLNEVTVAAHAVHTSVEDRQIMVQAGMSIVHCPRSNLALHGQTFSAADWQGLNIPLALGTDGRLSTEDLDLRAEARCAMEVHGWSADAVLDAMTVQGARVLGLADEIGSLTPGKTADCVLWLTTDDISGNPATAILNPNTQVGEVIIQGQNRWPLATSGESL